MSSGVWSPRLMTISFEAPLGGRHVLWRPKNIRCLALLSPSNLCSFLKHEFKMEQSVRSETSAHKMQTPGNRIQHSGICFIGKCAIILLKS